MTVAPAGDALRIGFVIPWISQGRGGTENVGQMMANAMAARGHQVRIWTFDDQRRPTRWPLHPAIELQYLEEAADPAADSRCVVAIAEWGPQLLVGLHMNRTLLRYARWGMRIGVPTVLSEHIDPRMPARIGTSTETERLAALHGATLVHLLTEAFRDMTPAPLRPKLRVIPNTADDARVQADPVGPQGGGRIATVARLVPRKNVARLLEEFAICARTRPGWVLDVIGDGPERAPLRKMAQDLGIADQVTFHGHVEGPYPLLEKMQLFVLPSLFEGFPMSTLEAMAHGLPLIGFAACNGVNEQIVDGVNGRLVPDSGVPGALAQAMGGLMDDADLRAAMGRASRARYESEYANEPVFDRWEALFREAAAMAPTPRRLDLTTQLASALREEA